MWLDLFAYLCNKRERSANKVYVEIENLTPGLTLIKGGSVLKLRTNDGKKKVGKIRFGGINKNGFHEIEILPDKPGIKNQIIIKISWKVD